MKQEVMNQNNKEVQIHSCLQTVNFFYEEHTVSKYQESILSHTTSMQSVDLRQPKNETNSFKISINQLFFKKTKKQRSFHKIAVRSNKKNKRTVQMIKRKQYQMIKKRKKIQENKQKAQTPHQQPNIISSQEYQKENISQKIINFDRLYQKQKDQLSHRDDNISKSIQQKPQQTESSPSRYSKERKLQFLSGTNHDLQITQDPSMISIRLTKKQHFIYQKIERNKVLKLKLKYTHSICNFFTPSFVLYNPQTNTQLIHAKKISPFRFSLSTSPNNYALESSNCIGILESNFSGSQLKFYTKLQQNEKWTLSCIIQNEKNIISLSKSGNFHVSISKDRKENQIQKSSFITQYSNKSQKQLFIKSFVSRKPIINQYNNIYTLEFRGRAKIPSSKNFILEQPQLLGRNTLLFGKSEKTQFNLDIAHPLNPLIGLAIALSRFNSKIF